MSDEIEIAGIRVPRAAWEKTPASIQRLVEVLSEQLLALEEKVNRSSQNSSKPPSTDGFGKRANDKGKGKKPARAPSGKPAPREARKLYPAEDCRVVHEVIPPACDACGASLSGEDSHPHRHQVIELLPVKPDVVEYRLHGLKCPCCDTVTRAELPLGVCALGYGERLSAMVALLSGGLPAELSTGVCGHGRPLWGAPRARRHRSSAAGNQRCGESGGGGSQGLCAGPARDA